MNHSPQPSSSEQPPAYTYYPGEQAVPPLPDTRPVERSFASSPPENEYSPGFYNTRDAPRRPLNDLPPIASQAEHFPKKRFLIATAITALLVIVVVSTFVVLMRKSLPSDWVASYQTSTLFGNGQAVYYIHWTEQNGSLTGQVQITARGVTGLEQAFTAPLTGTYNSQDHSVFLTYTLLGQAGNLSGTINDDIMTLRSVNTNNQQGPLVFHPGGESDYQQARQNMEKTP